MKKISFLLIFPILLSGCSLNKNFNNQPEVMNSAPQINQQLVSFEVVNPRDLENQKIDIKNGGEVIASLNYNKPGAQASLLGINNDRIFFYVEPTGFGGCIYSEYKVKSLYELRIDNKNVLMLDENISNISTSQNLDFAGYVKENQYIVRNLMTGELKSYDLPSNALMYRDFVISPKGDEVAMIGFIDKTNTGCYLESKTGEVEEAYVWNFSDDFVTKIKSGPLSIDKPIWDGDKVLNW